MQTPTTKKPRRTSWIRPSKMPPEETDAILAPPDEQESTLVSSEKPPHASRDFGAWDIRGFQDAMSASSERPPWVIEDLLLEETGTLVSAHPHAMKSLSWLGACLEAIVKKRVWGHFAAPNVQSTLFIETEDPPWLVEARIRGIAKGLGLEKTANVPGFHYACVGPFDLPKTEPYIKGLIEEIRPSFLVLSTLQNLLAGRQWKEQGDMQPIMASIIRISRLSPTVLLTHSPWNPKERRAAGSVTQTANFVTTAHYQKVTNHKTKETFVHVVMDSKAGAQETNFSLKLLTEGDPREPSSVRGLEYAGEGWPKGLGKAAVLAAIEDDPDASAKEIADRTQMGIRYVQKIISETSRGQSRKGRK